jgi:hypothetical protein
LLLYPVIWPTIFAAGSLRFRFEKYISLRTDSSFASINRTQPAKQILDEIYSMCLSGKQSRMQKEICFYNKTIITIHHTDGASIPTQN